MITKESKPSSKLNENSKPGLPLKERPDQILDHLPLNLLIKKNYSL